MCESFHRFRCSPFSRAIVARHSIARKPLGNALSLRYQNVCGQLPNGAVAEAIR
jgi:hypothetical protein